MNAVLWAEDFGDPIATPGADRRIAERRPIGQASVVRDPLGAGQDVVVDDLSSTGIRILGASRPTTGTEVRIGLPGAGSFAARVVRSDATGFSCAWLQPLDMRTVTTAFRDTVARADFGTLPTMQATIFGEPETTKLPPAARAGIIVGSAVALWGLILFAMF